MVVVITRLEKYTVADGTVPEMNLAIILLNEIAKWEEVTLMSEKPKHEP